MNRIGASDIFGLVARYLPAASVPATAGAVPLGSTFASASPPSLAAAAPGSHPLVATWNNCSEEDAPPRRLSDLLDAKGVAFILVGLFRIVGLYRLNDQDLLTIVVAVRPGSLSVASAREVVVEICLLLKTYVYCSVSPLFAQYSSFPYHHSFTRLASDTGFATNF